MVISRWRSATTSRPALWAFATLGVVALLAAAGWLVLKLPAELYSYVPDPKDRADVEATTRTGFIAGLAGLAALGSLAVTARTYRLTLQSQLTDRYTKAVAQLGDDKLDIRLGGIYALERLAVDSKRDHSTVVEVLSAYIRERTRGNTRTRPLGRRTAHPLDLPRAPEPLAVDIQAALTVLGRLPNRRGVSRADLSGANLTGARLNGADLTGADLRRADLTGALLHGVNLTKALLSGANLAKAQFNGANLTEAQLCGANLTNAWLVRTNMTEAQLGRALLEVKIGGVLGLDIVDTDLRGAKLSGADLTNAVLHGAKLNNANLVGANMAKAINLEQEQLDSARGSEDTLLPDGLTRPGAWAAAKWPNLAH